jgi:hypothetical protein
VNLPPRRSTMVCVRCQFGCNYGCVCYGFLPIPAVAPVTSTQAERRAAGVARSMIRRDYFGKGGRELCGSRKPLFSQFLPKKKTNFLMMSPLFFWSLNALNLECRSNLLSILAYTRIDNINSTFSQSNDELNVSIVLAQIFTTILVSIITALLCNRFANRAAVCGGYIQCERYVAMGVWV